MFVTTTMASLLILIVFASEDLNFCYFEHESALAAVNIAVDLVIVLILLVRLLGSITEEDNKLRKYI